MSVEAASGGSALAAAPALLFVAVGAFFAISPRTVVDFQIKATERQLRWLKESPPLIFMRIFGALFAIIGLIVFISILSSGGGR